jgi:hypothetical protein
MYFDPSVMSEARCKRKAEGKGQGDGNLYDSFWTPLYKEETETSLPCGWTPPGAAIGRDSSLEQQ